MTESQERILIELLAIGDAAYIPMRDWTGNRPANTYFALKRAPFVSWNQGGSENVRKMKQRDVEEMVKAKLLTVERGKAKLIGLALAPEAEATARTLAGLPSLEMSLAAMMEIPKHSHRESDSTIDRVWCAETTLNGGKGWDGTRDHNREFVMIEDAFLPAMRLGYVVSHSDCQGHVYYALSPFGWAKVDQLTEARRKLKPFKVEQVGKIKATEENRKTYFAMVKAESARLETAAPESTMEIGGIPLPVSNWGIGLYGPWLPWPYNDGRGTDITDAQVSAAAPKPSPPDLIDREY